MNNESPKPEKLKPQDSEEKNVNHRKADEKAVVKDEDKSYTREQANFPNPARKREESEQPVHPVKEESKD